MKLSRTTRPGTGAFLLLLLWGSLTGTAQAEDWYHPDPADFRAVYDRDDVDRRCQPWSGGNGYWSWVQTFYDGYTKRVFGLCVFHQTGWTEAGRQMEARLASEETRQQLRHALNTLGRDIAGEWAKDDAHCRINTGDLKHWGELTRCAARRDDGSGRTLLGTVRLIQSEVDQRLAAPAH